MKNNDNYRVGSKVDFQSNVYTVVKNDGDALIVKRSGSSVPIEIPKNQAKLVFEEGRTTYDVSRKLNG